MTDLSTLPHQMKERLHEALSVQDSEVKIQVRLESYGWIRIFIVTTAFEKCSLEEREDQINEILDPLNLTLYEYPIVDCKLLTPQEEAKRRQFALPQVPIWSEILFDDDFEEPVVINKNNHDHPFVVTFYSFKGGVGRSTSLAFVASILAARGYRVVMIDFDLEVPDLSFASPMEKSESNTYGVIDYIYQRYITPDEDVPKIDACIRRINIPVHGELYLIPAGEYNEGYIHRLADLDIRALYRSEVNPVHQLLKDVKRTLDPDIILIDTRDGFSAMGAIALFDQADLGIICFLPTPQSFAG